MPWYLTSDENDSRNYIDFDVDFPRIQLFTLYTTRHLTEFRPPREIQLSPFWIVDQLLKFIICFHSKMDDILKVPPLHILPRHTIEVTNNKIFKMQDVYFLPTTTQATATPVSVLLANRLILPDDDPKGYDYIGWMAHRACQWLPPKEERTTINGF
ncbi:hypothetical protein BDQ17DRAFT_1331849 [Cyathus striatus]|nr:hypothetical protein BDQ17DRAFT_1331849 [Cyathus striatus]